MDFLFDFLFEFVLEGIFEITIHNPKVRTWVKTLIFLVFAEALAGFLFWLSFHADDAAPGGVLVIRLLAAALGIGFLAGAIHGHRRDWKQD